MNNLAHKLHNHAQRKRRVRSRISGTTDRPRLSVYISNMHITAQLIDDTTQTTLAYVTTIGDKDAKGNLTEKATRIGTEIAKKAKAAKITKIAFDRNGRPYHGRVKALADAARDGGLEF
jgi:large subunit ribosomal protein L18